MGAERDLYVIAADKIFLETAKNQTILTSKKFTQYSEKYPILKRIDSDAFRKAIRNRRQYVRAATKRGPRRRKQVVLRASSKPSSEQ